jgi:hypothetical protein
MIEHRVAEERAKMQKEEQFKKRFKVHEMAEQRRLDDE